VSKPAPKTKVQTLELKAVGGPHNGKPPWQSPDPVTGRMIGGQVAYIRAALRHKRLVAPWGRRAGKTTGRPFLYTAEATMTKGRYTVGFLTANHTKAWEMFLFCKEQFGGLVKDSVGEPESQNRYIDLGPINAQPQELSFELRDPVMGPRFDAALGKNEGSRIYFWSGQHPHYRAIQGFPFRFDRISIDEAQQIHPGVTKIVNPMLLDSGGSLDVSGISDMDDIGNVWFEEYFRKASEPKNQHRWCSLNFPTFCNPNLDPEAMEEIVGDMLTSDDYEQYILARFVSGSGAVFTNLDAVFVLKPTIVKEHPAWDNLALPSWLATLLVRARSDLLRFWIYEPTPKQGHHYALTVDFAGRTRTRDATVIGVYDMTENAQVAVIQIRDMQSPDQLAWIEGVKSAYRAQELHGDNTPEGASLMAYLRERHGVGIMGHNFSSSNKPQYVKRAQFLFEMAEIRLIDCEAQREEFRIYKRLAGESKMGKDQPVSYSHPPGKHDDFVSSFLQIAPSMAHGRRAALSPDPDHKSMFDADGRTTLAQFVDGMPLPSVLSRETPSGEKEWRDVVLPPRYVR
jgi:hypothetical protein